MVTGVVEGALRTTSTVTVPSFSVAKASLIDANGSVSIILGCKASGLANKSLFFLRRIARFAEMARAGRILESQSRKTILS